MFVYQISSAQNGIDIDKSNIKLTIRIPNDIPNYILEHPSDIIYSYCISKNDKIIYSCTNVRLENHVAPLIDEEYEDTSEEPNVKDDTLATFTIKLSDLYFFKSLEYNIPNTSDVLLLRIQLCDKLQYFDEDENELVTFDYQLESISFEQVLMPPVDNFEVRKIPYQRLNCYWKHSKIGKFHFKIFNRKVSSTLIYAPGDELSYSSKNADLEPIEDDIYAVLPHNERIDSDCTVLTDMDKLSVITIKSKNLYLSA